MNVYLRELRAHRNGLIWWSLGMFMLVASGMAKYAGYKGAGQSAQQLFETLPKGMLALLGMTGLDLTRASGFYGVLFLYILVMAAVHASLLGAHVISEEERDRTSEFLYAKPVSRPAVLTGKLLAGLTDVVVLNLVTLVSSIYLVDYFGKGEPSSHSEVLLMMAGLFLLQLIFFSIGALVAGTVHRPKAAASIATSIMFLTFMISFFVNLSEKLDFLKYLTPFKYFEAAPLINDGRLDPVYVVLSVVITVLAVAGTYRFYSARDLTV